jgi:hypothetical protein
MTSVDGLRFLHRDTTVPECFEAALHITRKDPSCREVERTTDHIIFEKSTPVDPVISQTLKIPTLLTYRETWSFSGASDQALAKFLVQASVAAGKFTLRLGSHYAAEAGGVAVQTKVIVSGLEAFPIMKPLFETYVRSEFALRREREGRRIVRARKQAAGTASTPTSNASAASLECQAGTPSA